MKLRRLLPFAAVPLLFVACRPKPAAAPVVYNVRYLVVQPLTATPQEPGPSFLGVIRGDTETSLSFKVNGQIARIGPDGGSEDWKQGEFVAAGAVLAQIDTANFVNAAAAARARTDLARANFARNSELYAAANLAKSEYDATRAQKEMAEADLAQAEQYLCDTTLRAPYEGVVLARLARAGEFAAAGRPVLVLGDFRRVSLEVGVPDSVLGRIKVGEDCAVLVSAFEGGTFTGNISEIGIAADPASRLFRVVLKIDNAAGHLKSGMTASVHLGGRESRAVSGVLLPLSALVAADKSGAHSAVFVAGDDGRAHLRQIQTSEIVGSAILVTDGLKAGEKVVTLGTGLLTDNAPINAQFIAP
jgi:RND family efflux transporter MFP subunit